MMKFDWCFVHMPFLSCLSSPGLPPTLYFVPHPSFSEAMFDIRFGRGIDELAALFEAAELCNVVDRKGSYYYFGAEKLGQVR